MNAIDPMLMHEKLEWIHVPFTGGTEAVSAVMGGHVQVFTGATGNASEQVRAGRMRILASANPKRLALYPDVASILEKGYEYSCESGNCFSAPAGTPKEIQSKLEGALLQSFKNPAVLDVIEKWNCVYEPLDSESLQKAIVKHYKINGELLKKLGLGIYKKE